MNKPKEYLFDRVMFDHERPEELSLGEIVQLMIATQSKPGAGGNVELLWEKEGQLRDLIRRGVLPEKVIGKEIATPIYRTVVAMNGVFGKYMYPDWADQDSGEAISYRVCRKDLMRLKAGLVGGPAFDAWLTDSAPAPAREDRLDKRKKRAVRGTRGQILDHLDEIKKLHMQGPESPPPTVDQVMRFVKRNLHPSEKMASMKSFQNEISKLRREGVFPE